MSGGSIEAILTLDASGFHSSLETAETSVKNFIAQVKASEGQIKAFSTAISIIGEELMNASGDIVRFNNEVKGMEQFNKFSNGVRALAQAIQILGSDASTSAVGVQRVINIIREMEGAFSGGTIKVQGLASALRELRMQEEGTSTSTQKMDSELKQAKQDLMNLGNAVQPMARVREQADLMKAEFQRSRQELMNFARYGVQAFNQLDATSDRLKAQMESMNAEFERSKQELLEFARYGRSQFGTITAGVQQYERALEVALPTQRQMITNNVELANAERQKSSADRESASSSQQVASAEEKKSVATDKATNSMNRQTSATSRLSKAMSSLRMIGTMVASMMVYNLAHNLITATRETVNAKSEMNGYFQMLGYTSGEVDHFNKKLDQMIQKFPRINKYALGETISSIGVEFELSTKEMEKAMPVVSMITSEYLRAGRNVNEASLAVKDILQGEFQRLSRETGVKGEQLKEAGWSGDKNDVMGLLEALDKVGKSRNWDVFVAKANSLNDAVIILQNRFGEWSADMVEKIQPTILAVFNDLMVVATDFGKGMNKVFEWLGGNGLAQSIVKWGGLATVLGTVTVALIHYRTGANLTQIAQMGLTRSIGASILGLEAETVAQYGLGTAIASNVTGLKAQEVAEIGATKVLTAHIIGLDMATVSQYGLATAIGSSITGIEAETFALMGLKAQFVAVGTALAPVILAFGVIVGLLASQIIAINNTTEAYKKFNNMVQNGDQIISDAKDTVDTLTNSKKALTDKLATLKEGTSEYNKVASELRVVTDDLTVATRSYGDAVNSVAWSKHKQELYDEEKAKAQVSAQREINDALLDYGFEVKDANELSNQYWNDAITGWDQHYETLQKVNLQYSKNATTVKKSLDTLNNTKLDDKEVTVKIRRIISTGNAVADAKEELGNSTSLTEYVDKWAWLQIQQLQHSLAEFDINMAGKGLKEAIGGLAWGLLHFLGDNFTGALVQGALKGSPLEGSASGLGDWIKPFFEHLLANVGGSINIGTLPTVLGTYIKDNIDWSSLDKNFTDWLNGFPTWLENSFNSIDWIGTIKNGLSTVLPQINVLDIIFDLLLPAPASASDGSSDHPSFMEDVSAILGFDVQQWITDFQNDPLGTLGIELPDIDFIGTFIDNLFNNNTESGEDTGVKTFDFSWIPQAIYDSVKNAMETWVGDIDVVGFITNLIPSNVEGIYQWAMDNIITPLVDGVKQGILNTPILGDVASLLGVGGDTETSSQESGQTVGTNFTTGIQTGLAPLDGIINTAFQGLNLDSITSNFTSNTSTMVTNATSTATSVGASFLSMKNNHKSSVDSMVNNNTTAFRDMQVKSNAQMLAMRDSTSNVTGQMTNAWSLMKDSIIASANKIKNDSKSRFDTLGQTIGGFYRKIQNPSLWGGGAGYGSTPRRVARNPSVGKALVRGVRTRGGYAGGLDSKSTGATMSISQLKKQLCPSGECGSIFDGYKSTDEVNVWDFLQGIGGDHGLGGWNFAEPHKTFIKNKSDAWGTAPPIIDLVGGIHTSTGFKVGEFNEGTPKISFSTFEQIATAIFSRIPYRLYFDSSWKGSWLGALQSGACNCYDGALALMALARTFGFSTGMGHGTWTDPSGKKTAHVWAIINGVKMDTTGMQQRGTWRPSASAGGSPTGSSDSKTVNVTVDMSGATVYGVDDLDSRIQDSVQKGLQAEFNDPYTITI